MENNFREDTDELPLRIAFYLPQFSPVPENDAWYGRGFTEWTNLVKSRPLYVGHRQPELPGELGFYDLRVPETRIRQAQLAKAHGISGFCYYHYWFNGHRVMERIFDEVLTSGEPEFPFCLAWCNESWHRRWHDSNDEILINQTYSEDDDLAHIRWLIQAFKDPRYIYINGRPLFCVYVPEDLPNPEKTAALWKKECDFAGVPEPWLVGFETFQGTFLPVTMGFDASAEFIPHGLSEVIAPIERTEGYRRFEYSEVAQVYAQRLDPDWIRYPCIVTNWDNSPRRQNGRAILMAGSTPELYASWLESSLLKQRRNYESNGIVFINAWNEWCEGAHLEPDEYWKRSYLEATKRVVEELGGKISNGFPNSLSTLEVSESSLSETNFEELYEALYKKFINLQTQTSIEVSAIYDKIKKVKDEARHDIETMASQLDDERSKQLLPIQGYLEQVGTARGFHPGGWTAPTLVVSLRTNRALQELMINAYSPPGPERNLMAYIDDQLLATAPVLSGDLTSLKIPLSRALGDVFKIRLQVSASYHVEGDDRELGIMLIGIEAHH